MRYKAFGSTGLQVSEMALGTWGMGGSGWDDYSEDTRLDAIRAAVECGVNFIDTAPAYNNGVAERFVGKAVKEMGVRDKVIIATKCGQRFYQRRVCPQRQPGQYPAGVRGIPAEPSD